METSKVKIFPSNSSDFIKRMRHSKSMSDKLNINNNLFFYKSSKNSVKLEPKKENLKHLFVAHKLNVKERKNNFYKRGLNDIFNNEKYFFETKYYDYFVKVGSNDKAFSTLEPMVDINKDLNKKFFAKKKTNNFFLNRKIILANNQTKTLEPNSPVKTNMNESNNISTLSKYDFYKNPSNNNVRYYKRPSMYLNNKDFINDVDLRNLFQKCKQNNQKSRNYSKLFSSSSIKFNSSLSKEINNRISLQEKILKQFKRNEKIAKILVNKIKKKTKKENKDLLINQIDNYRNKIEKIDNILQKNKNYENYNKVIQWLSSLRQYNNRNNQPEINKFNYNTISNIYDYNNFDKTISSKKEQILENYINKLHYSFGNTSSLYSDIESNITPLYALILPPNNKNKEIIKTNNTYDKSSLPVITGKNLLDYEIRISKYLEGKKKIMVKKYYTEDDTKPLDFTNSKGIEKFHIPGSVNNAFNLHDNNSINYINNS